MTAGLRCVSELKLLSKKIGLVILLEDKSKRESRFIASLIRLFIFIIYGHKHHPVLMHMLYSTECSLNVYQILISNWTFKMYPYITQPSQCASSSKVGVTGKGPYADRWILFSNLTGPLLIKVILEGGENVDEVNPQINDFCSKSSFTALWHFLLYFVCLFVWFVVYLFAFNHFFSMAFTALPNLQRKKRSRDEFGVFYFRMGNSLPRMGLLTL